MSLVFQTDNYCVWCMFRPAVCMFRSVCILLVMTGESFQKLCNQVITDKDGAVKYKEVSLTLIPQTRNQTRMLQSALKIFMTISTILWGI